MSIAEYTYKFYRLERYCPGMYSNPKSRASKYVDGLRDRLRKYVLAGRPQNLSEAIESARMMEAEHMRRHKKKEESLINKKGKKELGKDKGNKELKKNEGYQSQQLKEGKQCEHCGKPHETIKCRWVTGGCFKCGKVGHKVSNCPYLSESFTHGKGKEIVNE
jgi:hypothetical protein